MATCRFRSLSSRIHRFLTITEQRRTHRFSRKGQPTSPVRWNGSPLVGATLVVALPVQTTEIDRGPPRDSHAMSRRSPDLCWFGPKRAPTRGAPTEFECAAGPVPRIPAETRFSRKGQSAFPVQWDGSPLVGATLVVALPVQATEIDRGPPRDSHAVSRRSTGSELVRAEEGAHKGRPYGIRMRGWTHSTHPGGDALLLGHILSVCSQECLVRRAQPQFRVRIQRRRSGLILLLVPSLRGTPIIRPA